MKSVTFGLDWNSCPNFIFLYIFLIQYFAYTADHLSFKKIFMKDLKRTFLQTLFHGLYCKCFEALTTLLWGFVSIPQEVPSYHSKNCQLNNGLCCGLRIILVVCWSQLYWKIKLSIFLLIFLLFYPLNLNLLESILLIVFVTLSRAH